MGAAPVPVEVRPEDTRAWIVRMGWRCLLFAHWDVAPSLVQAVLPAGFEVETFDGRAWLGVVPFLMDGVRRRPLPPLPTAARFTEVNLRTYARCGGQRGVHFLSLDAASRLVVAAGRTLGLPYFDARASLRSSGDVVSVECLRTHAGVQPAELVVTYQPVGAPFLAEEGSLEHWLTQRYALILAARDGSARRIRIDHEPWTLRRADATFGRNTLATSRGLALPEKAPHLLFARSTDVVALPSEIIQPAPRR